MKGLFRCLCVLELLYFTTATAMSDTRCAAEYSAFRNAQLSSHVEAAANELAACIGKYRSPTVAGGVIMEGNCPTEFRMPVKPSMPGFTPWWKVVSPDQLDLQALCAPSSSTWLGLNTSSSPLLIGKNAQNDFVTIFLSPEQLELFKSKTDANPSNTEGLATIVQDTQGIPESTLPKGFEPFVVVDPENAK